MNKTTNIWICTRALALTCAMRTPVPIVLIPSVIVAVWSLAGIVRSLTSKAP